MQKRKKLLKLKGWNISLLLLFIFVFVCFSVIPFIFLMYFYLKKFFFITKMKEKDNNNKKLKSTVAINTEISLVILTHFKWIVHMLLMYFDNYLLLCVYCKRLIMRKLKMLLSRACDRKKKGCFSTFVWILQRGILKNVVIGWF